MLFRSSLIRHAARHASDTEVVSRLADGSLHRTTWCGVELRARKLAQALARLGCTAGDRVATLAWNSYRHLELYFGTSGAGLVCHTINLRLFPEQIAWIAADADDRVLCFDPSLLTLVESIAPQLQGIRHFVLMTDPAGMPTQTTLPGLLCYEALIEAEDGAWDWPNLDENTASSLCYTSGTTGQPKGVLYSHRSNVLLAYAAALPDMMDCRAMDVVMPLVPMFHANGSGVPYVSALAGCKLVLPGSDLSGGALHALMESEQVSFSIGLPTVWLALLTHIRTTASPLSHLRRMVIGGAACPPALMAAFQDEVGAEVIHGWGMTELSPLGTYSKLKAKHRHLPQAERQRLLQKQGRVPFGIDMAIVDADGHSLPWDGASPGNLVVRGPWVVDRYFRHERSALVSIDGQGEWFPTGDVATIDADGFMQITDRTKDVIKSGGEWISSIDLENIAMAHPAVHEAAAIAVPHPKWDERPLLVVVKKPGAELLRDELLAFYGGRVATWQVPDDVVFVDQLPHTAIGKVEKVRLREQFKDHRLPAI